MMLLMLNQLNMNVFWTICFMFLCMCIWDLLKFLFYSFTYAYMGWPFSFVLDSCNSDLYFSCFFLVSMTAVMFSALLWNLNWDYVILEFIDFLLGYLYRTGFYRGLI